MKGERLQRRTEREKKQFPCLLQFHELDTNTTYCHWFTQKGAELWYYLVGRGYVCLQWQSQPRTDGYYYKLADIKEAMKKLWDEGLIKKGGYFYEERYFL